MDDASFVSQGAEAKIYVSGDTVIKYRLPKTYRHPEIDRLLIRRRTRAEKRILQRLGEALVSVPRLVKGTGYPEESTIYMERIAGSQLRDVDIDSTLAMSLGGLVRKIHDLNVVHGDLTTSNFILCEGVVFAIDFGLSFLSQKDEDKAVDLYVFERAVQCVHNESIVEWFYRGYGESGVISKLEEVRKRGRKREESAFG